MTISRRYQRHTLSLLESAISQRHQQTLFRKREISGLTTTAEGALRQLGQKFRALKHNGSWTQAASTTTTRQQRRRNQYIQQQNLAPWGALALIASASTIAAHVSGRLHLPWEQDDDDNYDEENVFSSSRHRGSSILSHLTMLRAPAAPAVTPAQHQSQQFATTAPVQDQQQQQQQLEYPRRLYLKGDGQTVAGNDNVSLYDKYLVDWGAPALGRGAFGSVHFAQDKTLHRGVAIKRIDKALTDPITFKREITAFFEIQKQGGHNHILSMRDIYEDDQYYYLVLDLAYGGEVYDDLIQHGPYTQAQAAGLIYQLASALSFLHSKIKMVHADLKPENLLLKHKNWNYNDLSLIDFGCAVPVESEEGANVNEKSVQNPLHYSGTTAYWPPERFQAGATPTPAMDMWSVGVILFILLTNKHPFDPEGLLTDDELHDNICNAKTAPKIAPHTVTMQTSDGAWNGVQDLLNRLMAVDPN
ncbi:hypothetical protein ACA910_002013 [Epithemia clementina (nom. ined.)]